MAKNQQVRIRPNIGTTPFEGFTAREFLEMVTLGGFEDMLAELVRGELQKMSPTHGEHSRNHGSIIVRLGSVLGLHAPIATDLAITIDETTVRAADIAVDTPRSLTPCAWQRHPACY